MTPHETGSTATPGTPPATAPPPRTFGRQGPTLGDLIDAYLQDYQVRQFRSQSTARGRVAHLTAFFGRAARAAALTTHQIRQYQLARRAAGAATGTINRETSALHRMGTLAVHWGWLDTVPGFPDRLRENPPRQGFFEHPEYLAVRAHLPAPWQDILDLAYYSGWRKQEILGLTWEEIDMAGGVIRLSPARSKTLVGRILPISQPIAEALARRRARRDPDSLLVFHRDGIAVRRWRTAWRTACQAAGVPTRFLHDCRRTAARNLIRANVPERVAMLLTGHKSRAIFDRYNIINEQELLDAGDQLVEYLAQQAQAAPARRRLHPVRTAGRRGPDTACLCAAGRSRPNTVRAGQRSWHTWRRGGPTRPNTDTRRARPSLQARRPGGPDALLGDMQSDRLGGGSPSQRPEHEIAHIRDARLDRALLPALRRRTERRRKRIRAPERLKRIGLHPVPAGQHLLDRDRCVVEHHPVRHAAHIGKRRLNAIQQRLESLDGIRLREIHVGVGQGRHHILDLPQHTGDLGPRFSERAEVPRPPQVVQGLFEKRSSG